MRAAAIAFVLVLAATAHADPVRIAVTSEGVPAWQAEAVRAAIAGELDRDGDRDELAGMVVDATLSAGALRWSILVGGAVMRRGELAVPEADVRSAAGAIRSDLHRASQHTGADVEAAAVFGAPPQSAVFGLVAVAVFLVVPFLVVRPRAVWRLRSFRRTLATVVTLGAVAAAILGLGERIGEASWAVLIGGGLAWGTFAAVTLPVICPALPNLDRVEHGDLLRVLGRWTLLSLQRIAEVAVVYAPFVAAMIGASILLEVPTTVLAVVIAPAWALCVRLWVHAWVELAAAKLDRDHVVGDTTPDNPWHLAVRGYFMGYARRVGWTTDDRVIEGIRFLPGKTDDVITYGGGLTHARIVVPRTMLEGALAPYGRPHDYAAPRISTLHWTLWNQGLVVPTEVGAEMATREQRQPRSIAIEGDVESVQLGEVPTLAGIVEPTALDPRPAFRPHEDPLWLDFDAGEEYDGTDAGDKDFLFGVLVHELGRIRRHEDRRAALGLVLGPTLDKRPRLGRVIAAIGRGAGRAVAPIEDAHVRLNFARDHFIQYLAWRLWQRDDLLTARAYAPELARQTDGITDELAASTAGDASGRARLAAITRTTVPSGRARLVRRLALTAALLAAIGGVAIAIVRAVEYHDTYRARITTPADHDLENQDGQGK